MAQLQLCINLQPFSELRNDISKLYENQLGSRGGIAKVDKSKRTLDWHQHLKGTSMSVFDRLIDGSR